MINGRAKIRDILLALGVPKQDVVRKIQTGIFPWYARILVYVGLIFGRGPYTSELGFVRDLADCRSGTEIDDAFFRYETDPDRKYRLLLACCGLTPRRSRVYRFYRILKERERERSGVISTE